MLCPSSCATRISKGKASHVRGQRVPPSASGSSPVGCAPSQQHPGQDPCFQAVRPWSLGSWIASESWQCLGNALAVGPWGRLMVFPLEDCWMNFYETFFFFFFKAEPEAYGSSQAKGQIGATAAGLHHSHSHMGSEPHLQPTPQLTAMPTEWG